MKLVVVEESAVSPAPPPGEETRPSTPGRGGFREPSSPPQGAPPLRLVLLVAGRHSGSVTARPTGTVTLLFTDVEGSTKLLDRLGPSGMGRVDRRDDLPSSMEALFFDVKRGSVQRKKGWLVIVCAAAVSLLVTGFALSAPGPRTLRFLEVSWPDSKSTFVDHNQNNRRDVGDAFISGSDLYSWAGGKRGAHIGVIRVVCTIAAPNAGQCQGSFSLPGGTLETAGYVHFGTTTRVPIIGGTGIYFAAHGTFTSTTIGRPDSLKSAATIRLLP
jgi:hypothetical protein